jgi:hypothetical protein
MLSTSLLKALNPVEVSSEESFIAPDNINEILDSTREFVG